jgi:hypothetical protein
MAAAMDHPSRFDDYLSYLSGSRDRQPLSPDDAPSTTIGDWMASRWPGDHRDLVYIGHGDEGTSFPGEADLKFAGMGDDWKRPFLSYFLVIRGSDELSRPVLTKRLRSRPPAVSERFDEARLKADQPEACSFGALIAAWTEIPRFMETVNLPRLVDVLKAAAEELADAVRLGSDRVWKSIGHIAIGRTNFIAWLIKYFLPGFFKEPSSDWKERGQPTLALV